MDLSGRYQHPRQRLTILGSCDASKQGAVSRSKLAGWLGAPIDLDHGRVLRITTATACDRNRGNDSDHRHPEVLKMHILSPFPY